jgi:bifunctional UDP-N-acetylglucosamine pyrophosphorylase / glucosamine-1-phosphate N-acetyltransferase
MQKELSIVILAAGEGTRMKSSLPKVLHALAGKPLLEHVIETAQMLAKGRVFVVYGHGGEGVKQRLAQMDVKWIEQKKQLGTGHAVLQAIPHIPASHRVLVLYGDVPLIRAETLRNLIKHTPKTGLGWLTVQVDRPQGLGRIIRDMDANPVAIIEEKDATELQKTITEINTGICLIPAKLLKSWLPKLKNTNTQKEYYLTDTFALGIKHGISIVTVSPGSVMEVKGVNDKLQLSKLEREFQKRQAEKLLLAGVTLLDPYRFDLRGRLKVGRDVIIDVNVVLEGDVKMGERCHIGTNVYLKNVTLGNDVTIFPNSVLEDAKVADECNIGPFARLRPGTELKEKAKVGNFVEIKKSVIGAGSKVSHLTYIGDTLMGKDVNVGAGTITCNYDGVNKHQTKIKDGVFIGSNVSLVAPVTVGTNATIGASSAINKSAPAEKLTVARAKQVTIPGWKRPIKQVKK